MRTPRLLALVVLLAALALAACDTFVPGPPAVLADGYVDDGLVLTAEGTSFREGAWVLLTLKNESPVEIGIGVVGCTADFERWDGEAWVEAQPYKPWACILPLYLVPPGGELRGGFHAHFVPGTYRVVHTAEAEPARRPTHENPRRTLRAVTAPFAIY